MDPIKKIALGTVQFGLNYGINNNDGQVSEEEISKILTICKDSGIDLIDTAFAYGESENVLGRQAISDFKVITKLPPASADQVNSFFEESMKRLNLSSTYGYLIHNYSIYSSDKGIWNKLIELKKQGKIRKIGVSLYSPDELFKLWDDNVFPDIVQIPFNIFDRRFAKVFKLLKDKGVEIHSRSSFLQGLFFKPLNQLPTHFQGVSGKLKRLHEISTKKGLSIAQICLRYIINNDNIDKIVMGVDNSTQLEKNISDVQSVIDSATMAQLDELEVIDKNILNPSLWKI